MGPDVAGGMPSPHSVLTRDLCMGLCSQTVLSGGDAMVVQTSVCDSYGACNRTNAGTAVTAIQPTPVVVSRLATGGTTE